MPKTYKKRRAPAKKNYRKNISSSRSLAAFSSQSAAKVFPSIKAVNFTYSDNRAITIPSGTLTPVNFRANSVYDPDIGIGGTKPRYVETLLGSNGTNAPYRRYSVLGCDCEATIINQSDTHIYAAISMFSNQSTAPSSLDEARERSDTIVRVIPPLGSGSAVAKLHMRRQIAKMLGVKDMLDNPDMKANAEASPLAQANCTITVFNPYSVSTATAAVNTRLIYDTRLFVKNDVADS